MNGVELNVQARRAEQERMVSECVDVVAIRSVLRGDPQFLTDLEKGVTIDICDVYRLDRATVARGMDMCKRTLERHIRDRRNAVVTPEGLAKLTAAAHETVVALVEAVAAGDGVEVATILRSCGDLPHLSTLVIVLASLVSRSPHWSDELGAPIPLTAADAQ